MSKFSGLQKNWFLHIFNTRDIFLKKNQKFISQSLNYITRWFDTNIKTVSGNSNSRDESFLFNYFTTNEQIKPEHVNRT